MTEERVVISNQRGKLDTDDLDRLRKKLRPGSRAYVDCSDLSKGGMDDPFWIVVIRQVRPGSS